MVSYILVYANVIQGRSTPNSKIAAAPARIQVRNRVPYCILYPSHPKAFKSAFNQKPSLHSFITCFIHYRNKPYSQDWHPSSIGRSDRAFVVRTKRVVVSLPVNIANDSRRQTNLRPKRNRTLWKNKSLGIRLRRHSDHVRFSTMSD